MIEVIIQTINLQYQEITTHTLKMQIIKFKKANKVDNIWITLDDITDNQPYNSCDTKRNIHIYS